jgi:hypothetical protein
MAFERARAQGDLTPLVQTVRRWWFEAEAWCDPEGQREFLARVDTYRSEGPPPRCLENKDDRAWWKYRE